MNIVLPPNTANTLERLRRSMGVSRVKAFDFAIQQALLDFESNKVLDAPNPAADELSDDELFEIATAAVKRSRREKYDPQFSSLK
jgi:hypothetical protein